MNRPSDWRERELGLDLTRSCIVQAPAGSGKTELLTQRMLGLLSLVENPEEVVAITFTRKAAAEMGRRLFGHLQAANMERNGLNGDEELKPHEQVSRRLALAVLENDRMRGWDLLEQANRLRIRTIDSLCSELARQLPILSGLGASQQIAKDADALYRLAAVRTMSVIEDKGDELQGDIVRVLDRYDNQYDRLVDLLTSMLANREQWIGHILDARSGDGFDRQRMENALRTLIETRLESTLSAIPFRILEELPRFYRYAIGNEAENSEDLERLLEICGGLECDYLDLPTTAESLPGWKTMVDGLLTQNGEMRKSAPNAKGGFPALGRTVGEEREMRASFKADFVDLLDEHRENEGLKEAFKAVRALPCPEYEDEAWESLESLMRIMIRAAENWELVMAESGEVDFGEVTLRAIRSLGSENAPSDLALRMDYSIQHLLVDEFQDTSAYQVRLLEQLTAGWSEGDGRTLFLVGDPMQSIYRFRKAEVSLFIKTWNGELLDHIRFVPLRLSVNFRSTRPIVDWVNRNFPKVMPPEDDPVMGAVTYSEASVKPAVTDAGNVHIEILPERDDEEEARQVVNLIGRCDPSQTVAVLVRSRNHASTILAELDRRKTGQARFRYQAIQFTPLAETPVVIDLVSLTLALLQPVDRLAWLATLRTPCVGLDLADLDTLVAGDSEHVLLDAISAVVNGGGVPGLSADGRHRIQRTGPLLLSAAGRRGREPVRSLVESTWIALGGPACVENDSELDDASTYFDLLDDLESENLPVDRDTLDLRLEDLYAEPDSTADGSLQILTIYAAKGLQFDTVILPGLNRNTAGDKAKLLHWFELAGTDQIVMSPMRDNREKDNQKKSSDLIEFISFVEKQRSALEGGRLLYVAATRAIRNLFLFAAIKPTARGEIRPYSSSLMGCLWPAIHATQAPLIEQAALELQAARPDEEIVESRETIAALPQAYRRLDADWKAPGRPDSVQRVRVEPAEPQDYIEFSWAGEDARHTGNLVHRLLQLISEIGPGQWNERGGMAMHRDWCRHALLSEGIRDEKAEFIISRATTAIENCLASNHGSWILAEHDEARNEYAITAVLDGRPVNLILDRTFVENGNRWIIDYKTSSHEGGDMDAFLENEKKRYREQLSRYREAVAINETRPIRTALYFPMLDELVKID